MDQEIDWAAVTRVLDLRDVFELINDRLDERPLAQQQPVGELKELVVHVLAQFGDETQSVGEQETLGERRGDVALVAKEAPEKATCQAWHWTPVVGVARS